MVTVYPKSAGKTIDSLVSEIEGGFEGAATSAGNNGILVEGRLKTCASEVFARVGHVVMTNRDVEIETLRLLKTDKSIRPQDSLIDSLAKAHVAEMAQVLFDSYLRNLTPSEKEIESTLEQEYKIAAQKGLPKEAFLNNWGVTEKEFKNIIANKIAYEKVMAQATGTGKTDAQKNEMATKYLERIASKYDIDPTGVASTRAYAMIKLFGENIAVVTYALFGGPEDADIEKLANSIVFDNSSLPSGKLYIFSPNK